MLKLADYSIQDLKALMEELGEKRYRAEQIFSWIHRGVCDFSQMTNISQELIEKLNGIAVVHGAVIYKKFSSGLDETVKYLIKLDDGNFIETVLMSYKHGLSLCVSTQVGCRMGCAFCASAGLPFIRDLTPGEMLAQVTLAASDAGGRISNVVLMGVGEGLDNYDNVIKFIKNAIAAKGVNIGQRHISVSTCGLVDKIGRLSGENLSVTLSVSLHGATDGVRSRLMPVNNKYNIKSLIDACKRYSEKTNRRIVFEYSLIKDVNDTEKDAEALCGLLRGMLCHINLININPVPGRGFYKSGNANEFLSYIIQHGISATFRRELGLDINAACGQLRANVIGDGIAIDNDG